MREWSAVTKNAHREIIFFISPVSLQGVFSGRYNMDEATPLTEIPLSNSNGPQGQTKEPHLDTTYGRYERAPFRQYSERKVQDQEPLIDQPRRFPSKDNLLQRVLSRQSRLERTVFGGHQGTSGNVSHSKSGVSRKWSNNRPQPTYSLTGPRHPPPSAAEPSSERPGPQWSLGSPFSHFHRQGRNSRRQREGRRGHPQGQVGYIWLFDIAFLILISC